MMKAILNSLYNREQLSKSQAKEVLINISNNQYSTTQIASFITVYLMREIQVEELIGFREALLELAIPFDLRGQDAIDLCGTGGDGKNTFNISTLASFVVAGAGYKVVKHGNYGVSSISGSSNVLEQLGHRFTNNTDILLTQLDNANICFCHAPLFHPALKGVGPIRKSLGVKTFFNMLGPLVNPAQPNHQLVGVFNLRLANLYKYIFQSDHKKYHILHSLDGYDEVSLTSDCHTITNRGDYLLSPVHFGMKTLDPISIIGGKTIKDAGDIFINILQNKGTKAQRDVVVANAALAIKCYDQKKSMEDCVLEAKASLLQGLAFSSFQKLIETS